MDTKNNDAKTSITEEIEAAQAELRAAQDKLNAMKAKAASEAEAAEAAADAAKQPAGVVAEAQADASLQGSSPIELNAEPVEQASSATTDPHRVPYTTGGDQPPSQHAP